MLLLNSVKDDSSTVNTTYVFGTTNPVARSFVMTERLILSQQPFLLLVFVAALTQSQLCPQ